MSLSTDEAAIINQSNPDFQRIGLGDEVKDIQDKATYNPMCLRFSIDADATGGQAVTIPYAFELTEVVVRSRCATSSGAITIYSGATAVTDGIACGTNHALARAGTVDDSVSSIAVTDTITAVAANAADRGDVVLFGYRS